MIQDIALIILCICSAVRLGLEIKNINRVSSHAEPKEAPAPARKRLLSNDEQEELRLAKEKYKAEAEAFQELMNFNADKAYAYKPKE